jgi:hypothetical protein
MKLLLAALLLAPPPPTPVVPPMALPPHLCRTDPGYRLLDFWLGSWEVKEGDELAGTNAIDSILDGCAVVERWHGADGHDGQSLFYRELASGEWRQVWVTDAGPMKEKRLVKDFPSPGIRFAGEIRRKSGELVHDRTTLTPLPDGSVRQVIEQSTDGGKTWRTGFDAIYRRK